MLPFRTFLAALTVAIATTGISAERPGSLDPSFDAGAGVSARSSSSRLQAAFQSNGKAVLVGELSPWPLIARLNPDGSVDRTFVIGEGFEYASQSGDSRAPRCVEVQADDKIVVAGDFPSYEGVTRLAILRLNADGSHDTSFDAGSVLQPDWLGYRFIRHLFVQADGKIVAAGAFTYASGGATRSSLIRFNQNGTLDTSFTPPDFGVAGRVNVIDVSAGGQIVMDYIVSDGAGSYATPFRASAQRWER